jgi:hypothetical protein
MRFSRRAIWRIQRSRSTRMAMLMLARRHPGRSIRFA